MLSPRQTSLFYKGLFCDFPGFFILNLDGGRWQIEATARGSTEAITHNLTTDSLGLIIVNLGSRDQNLFNLDTLSRRRRFV
jgi:hypothetical protein